MKRTAIIFLTGVFITLSPPLKAQEKLFDLADRVVDLFSGQIYLDSAGHPIDWVIAPVVAYAPETSWQFGVGGKVLFRPRGVGEWERTSFVAFAVRFTLNQQFLASPDYTIFTKDEKYIHRGEIAYIKFPRLYYGIGNNTPISNEEIFDYSTASIEHLIYRNVFSKMYVGLGFKVATNFDITLEQDGILATERPIGIEANKSVGLDVGLLFDNRDNVLSTRSGILAEFRQRFYKTWLGSDYNYAVGELDFRYYHNVFDNPRSIFAWQVYGYASNGQTPFTELAPLGGDMIMRGYYEGRYRDNHMLATQVEYRFPIWRELGAVAFAGVGDVANRFQDFNFPDIKYSLGAGLRYLLLPEENLNIRLDFAIGKDTQNFYINISEAF